ncbi:MAG: lectin [Deltaproteobacteria bacterium]|nr:MAG: lectin [Deltaproteobacteria bacterium]
MKKKTVLTLFIAVFVIGTVMAASAGDRLNAGNALLPGQHLISQNRIYTFSLQKDGNMVLRKAESLKSKKKHILWNSGTSGPVDKLLMQQDGNLVLYHGGKAKWSTGTNGNPGAYFIMQNDGNAVVYSKNNKALWSTNTPQ